MGPNVKFVSAIPPLFLGTLCLFYHVCVFGWEEVGKCGGLMRVGRHFQNVVNGGECRRPKVKSLFWNHLLVDEYNLTIVLYCLYFSSWFPVPGRIQSLEIRIWGRGTISHKSPPPLSAVKSGNLAKSRPGKVGTIHHWWECCVQHSLYKKKLILPQSKYMQYCITYRERRW